MSDPCERRVATAEDGASVAGCAHGGQVLGWVPAGSSRDRLWVSPSARCGPGLALRGGVPVIFPRFAARELPGGPDVPRHGLARDRSWRLSAGRGADGTAELVATLSDDESTRAAWPHRFTLTLTTTASGDRLRMRAVVRNDGDATFDFVLALHTYFAVSDAAQATVHRLAGRRALDNVDGHDLVLGGLPLPALGPTDMVVPQALAPRAAVDPSVLARGGPWDAPAGAELVDPGHGGLEIRADRLDDLVIWNPGTGHGLGDVPPGGASSFVCLEAARLAPVALEPGRTWSAAQYLLAR